MAFGVVRGFRVLCHPSSSAMEAGTGSQRIVSNCFLLENLALEFEYHVKRSYYA